MLYFRHINTSLANLYKFATSKAICRHMINNKMVDGRPIGPMWALFLVYVFVIGMTQDFVLVSVMASTGRRFSSVGYGINWTSFSS